MFDSLSSSDDNNKEFSIAFEMIGTNQGHSTSNDNSEAVPLFHEPPLSGGCGGGEGGGSVKSTTSLEIRTEEDVGKEEEEEEGNEYSPMVDGGDDDKISKLVNAQVPQCRICLESGGEDIIAPCYCKGTQKYVHRTCLDNWRSTKEGFAFSHCTECRAVFSLRANVHADRWWLTIKFQFLVIRDHAFIFIMVQLVVASLGLIVYRFYGKQLREMFGYEEHPYGFYSMAVVAIVLVGLLYGCFIAIIFGQRINERHYHVLEKQEMTKEYIVENRDESENPTELDSSHVMELRTLELY